MGTRGRLEFSWLGKLLKWHSTAQQSAVLCPPVWTAPLIIVVASKCGQVFVLALARGAIALTRCASTWEALRTKPAGATVKLLLLPAAECGNVTDGFELGSDQLPLTRVHKCGE